MSLTPRLLKLINEIDNCRYLEIGVCRGESAEKVLALDNVNRYWGVDPFLFYDSPPSGDFEFGYRDRQVARIKRNGGTYDVFYDEAKNRIDQYTDKAVIIRAFSHDAAHHFDEVLDCLYIDGNHAYEYVLKDLEEWCPKVRPGGLIIGDDFTFHGGDQEDGYGGRDAAEVDKACIEYCGKRNIKFSVIDGNFVFVKPYKNLEGEEYFGANKSKKWRLFKRS